MADTPNDSELPDGQEHLADAWRRRTGSSESAKDELQSEAAEAVEVNLAGGGQLAEPDGVRAGVLGAPGESIGVLGEDERSFVAPGVKPVVDDAASTEAAPTEVGAPVEGALAETAEPATEVAEPATEVTEPAAEVVAMAEPATEVAEPATEVAKSATEAAAMAGQATEVAAPAAELSDAAAPTEVAPAVVEAPAFVPAAEVQEGEITKKKRRKRHWPLITTLVVLLLAGAYVGAAFLFANKVPANTAISGVPVGGMNAEGAKAALAEGLESKLTAPREVTAQAASSTETIDPAAISLEVDYKKTVDDLIGFSLNPVDLWRHIVGGENYDAVLSAAPDQLSEEVDRLAGVFNAEPKDAQLAFEGAQAKITEGVIGTAVDKEQAGQAITEQWLAGDTPVLLPVTEQEPAITTEALQEFVDKSVSPLLSGPITVSVKDSAVELSAEQIAGLLSFAPEAGEPALAVNQDGLTNLVREQTGDLLSAPKDARITIENGAPAITPSEVGEALDAEQVAKALLDIPGSSNRTVEANVITSDPEFTTEDAEKLGVKEVVAEISTPLTSDSVRTQNLLAGTKAVTNTLVKPGEQFNLGDALGPVDAEHGYVASGVVKNGFSSTAMGGGLSQLSTNTFNVGYRSGMKDVAHKPHSLYFSRYPAGIEATLWDDQVKMIWENNTPYGALVEAWVGDGQVHTRLWSTHYWDVQVWQGNKFNFTNPETHVNNSPDCIPNPAGGQGFSITVGRKVSHDGQVAEDSQYTWTYQPVHAVVCGGN